MPIGSYISRSLINAALLILLAAILSGFLANAAKQSPALDDTRGLVRTSVAGTTVFVQVADTPATRARGLSGTEALESNRGMLFLFPRDGYYSMWMKDMRYSIDILWLSESGIIVHMERNVAPETYPETFTSPIPARSVLELPAGFIDTHELLFGERVTILS